MPDQEIIIEGDAGFVPKASPSDTGKVLGVLNSSGDVGWVVDQSGTFIQVQADWAETDSSQPSYIDHKPDLSVYAESSDLATVATTGSYDDLLNKPTIPAAQVNSDWNSNSGASQILNKPSLATVATTGDYGDLLNKPSIPAAQVNSDWNASSGVAQILNKPDLSAYATDTELIDGLATKQDVISDLDTIRSGAAAGATAAQPSDLPSSDELVPSATSGDSGKVLTVDSQGNPGWVTPSSVTIDQTYNASSTNAQSGTAVAQAIAAIPAPSVDEVPDVTSSDDGKVLTASYSGGTGSYSWQTAQGGGGSYTAGDGIDITSDEISVYHDNTLSITRTYGAASTLEPFSDTNYVFETNSDFKGWVKNGSAGEYLRVSIPANAFTYDTGYTAYLGIADDSNTAFYPIQLSATALSNGYRVDAQTVDLPLPVGSSTGWEGSVNLSSSNLWLVIAAVQSGNVSGFATYYYTRQSMQVAKSNPGGAIAVTNPIPASTQADSGKVLKVNASGNAEWGNLLVCKTYTLNLAGGNYYFDLPSSSTFSKGAYLIKASIYVSSYSASQHYIQFGARMAGNTFINGDKIVVPWNADCDFGTTFPFVVMTIMKVNYDNETTGFAITSQGGVSNFSTVRCEVVRIADL